MPVSPLTWALIPARRRKETFYVPYVGKALEGQSSAPAMVFQALDEICREFDLGQPIWLDSNIKDFKLHDKTRFTRDSFIEEIDFDYLEIHVIEE